VLVDRVQLTRQLAEVSTSGEVVAGKLEKAGQEVIEVRLALAPRQGQAGLLAGRQWDRRARQIGREEYGTPGTRAGRRHARKKHWKIMRLTPFLRKNSKSRPALSSVTKIYCST
jgi:hypothetical protein